MLTDPQRYVSSPTLVSFVVIAFNEAANIAHTLAAIEALSGLGDYEIVVVDDHSRDRTAEIVRDIALDNPRIRLIELDRNRGRGYARNRGIAEALGDLIATVDGDIVLPADWLAVARSAIGSHDAVGGTALPDGDAAYLHRRFGLTPRLQPSTTTITGNNGLYRREVFDLVNFDPALRDGEDVALNHAMKRRGLCVATVPGLVVRHQESKSLRISLRWLFQSGKGATRQLVTYREVRVPDVVAAGFVVAAACGVAAAARGRSLTAVAVPAAFVAAASVQHTRTRFDLRGTPLPTVAAAVATDSALLTAYFLGRVAGLTALRQGWTAARQGRTAAWQDQDAGRQDQTAMEQGHAAVRQGRGR
jgi:GT2 family glycosyltransferase